MHSIYFINTLSTSVCANAIPSETNGGRNLNCCEMVENIHGEVLIYFSMIPGIRFFCINVNNTTSCTWLYFQSDYGMPLVCDSTHGGWVLVGVRSDWPDFTRVDAYKDWIELNRTTCKEDLRIKKINQNLYLLKNFYLLKFCRFRVVFVSSR